MAQTDISHKTTTSNNNSSIVLVGNPNVGKSVVFGYLTGKYVTVSNYPGTTVTLSHGKMSLNGESLKVTDTPGTNDFTPQSEDEKATRDLLLSGDYKTVLQVADTKNLRRSLYVTIQLAEMKIPFVLALNMADEAHSRGISINIDKLEDLFGIPVIPTTATQRKGLPQVKQSLQDARESRYGYQYPSEIEYGISQIEDLLPDCTISKRSLALMLLSSDTSLSKWLQESVSSDSIDRINDIINQAQTHYKDRLQNVIAKFRMSHVDKIMDEVYVVSPVTSKLIATEVGKLAMHPAWGIGVVLAVLYFTYWFVGLFGAGTLVDFFEVGLFGQYINPMAIRIFDWILPFNHSHVLDTLSWEFTIPLTSSHGIETGIAFSREVVIPNYSVPDGVSLTLLQTSLKVVHDFFVGDYGVITMALSYGIAIVLPIVGTFFLLFSILEDTGYLPRLAVMLNRVFKMVGLNGKAILPMVLGLGCDTMATMTARIMETRKERIIVTLLLALGIPCSAQLGVLLALVSTVSIGAMMVWLGLVVGVLLSVGFLASKVLKGDSSAFILEIPPIRKPQLGNIVIKTTARMEWYFKEVIPLFILGTIILFFLDVTNLLIVIRDAASPLVVSFLGLPTEMTEAFLIGFLRRDFGAVYLFDAVQNGLLSPNQILVAMITITLFVPCVANVFIIVKELNLKTAIRIVGFIFPFAFLVGGLLNFTLNFFNITF